LLLNGKIIETKNAYSEQRKGGSVMSYMKQEIEEAKKLIRRLDAEYLEELKKEAALAEPGRKRGAEDGKSWEVLLKNLNVDNATKLAEHEKADAKKAEATYRTLEKGFKTIPETILEGAKEQLRLEDHLNATLAWDGTEPARHWFSYSVPFDRNGNVDLANSSGGDGKAEGDCGEVSPIFNTVLKPRSHAVGAGTGWADQHSASVKCWFWYYVTGAFTQHPGMVFVWPYFDMHGNYWVRSNDGFFTSKEASIRLSMTTRVFRPGHSYSPYFTWAVLDKGGGNIDEDGRVDFTGWNNTAKGESLVDAGESLTVQVIVELRSFVEGSGSHALLDFQTGDGNFINIPFIRVWVP